MSKRRLCSLHDFRVAKPWDERRRRVFANRKQSRGPLLDVGHDDTSVAWSGYFRVYAKQINGEQVRRLYNMFVGYERFPRTCRDNNPFNAPPPRYTDWSEIFTPRRTRRMPWSVVRASGDARGAFGSPFERRTSVARATQAKTAVNDPPAVRPQDNSKDDGRLERLKPHDLV